LILEWTEAVSEGFDCVAKVCDLVYGGDHGAAVFPTPGKFEGNGTIYIGNILEVTHRRSLQIMSRESFVIPTLSIFAIEEAGTRKRGD
jgi:hypothetical protein